MKIYVKTYLRFCVDVAKYLSEEKIFLPNGAHTMSNIIFPLSTTVFEGIKFFLRVHFRTFMFRNQQWPEKRISVRNEIQKKSS